MSSTASIPVLSESDNTDRLRFNLEQVLFVCALIPGIYQFLHPTGYGFGNGFEMAAIARNLASQGTFGNPFAPAITGPTAVNPPLYPLFLAALIKLSGPHGLVLVAVTSNIVANALVAALMPRLSMVFYGDLMPGAFAGALWIFAMPLMPQWDTSFTVAGLVSFCLFSAQSMARQRRGNWSAVAVGLFVGMLSLLNPATVLIFAPWVAYLFLLRRAPLPYALRYAATFALVVALCNVPWIIRNYRIWHVPVLRTNFGLTIYSSNNDCAQSSLYQNGRKGCYQNTHPIASRSETQLLQTLGEVQYDRRRTADTLNWIRSHPQRFRQLTLTRFVEFWFPDPEPSPSTNYAIWVITLLSIPGIVLMAKRRHSATLFALSVWVLYPLMFYIVVSCDRYRHPILWTSMLPAGYCLAGLLPRTAERPAIPPRLAEEGS